MLLLLLHRCCIVDAVVDVVDVVAVVAVVAVIAVVKKRTAKSFCSALPRCSQIFFTESCLFQQNGARVS